MTDPRIDPALVRERLALVHDRIQAAGGRVGGSQGVEVVAVTKTFGVEAIRAARDAGCRAIGENYAQELAAKWAELADDDTRPEAHFIGRLQTNKIRLVADVVDLWQSVDRISVVDGIAARAPGARVLLQVAATGEEGKGGCPPAELEALRDHALARGLRVEGLMTVGPTVGSAEAARAAFASVRALCDRWGLAVCSMGMSHDLEVAVQEGSTMVRIGTALFGAR